LEADSDYGAAGSAGGLRDLLEAEGRVTLLAE
jgi:hypothetical protein